LPMLLAGLSRPQLHPNQSVGTSRTCQIGIYSSSTMRLPGASRRVASQSPPKSSVSLLPPAEIPSEGSISAFTVSAPHLPGGTCPRSASPIGSFGQLRHRKKQRNWSQLPGSGEPDGMSAYAIADSDQDLSKTSFQGVWRADDSLRRGLHPSRSEADQLVVCSAVRPATRDRRDVEFRLSGLACGFPPV
jgi:hypothetical protein